VERHVRQQKGKMPVSRKVSGSAGFCRRRNEENPVSRLRGIGRKQGAGRRSKKPRKAINYQPEISVVQATDKYERVAGHRLRRRRKLVEKYAGKLTA